MNWEYKNVTITIESDGKFYFSFNGQDTHCQSLEQAKAMIDDITGFYYNVNTKFVRTLLEKLNDREKDFVKQLFYETYASSQSGGYYGGLTPSFLFNVDFYKVGKNLDIIKD